MNARTRSRVPLIAVRRLVAKIALDCVAGTFIFLTACQTTDLTSYAPIRPRLVIGVPGCPDYWAQYGITDCRAITQFTPEGKALLRVFSGPRFRLEDVGCQALESQLVTMLKSTTEANSIFVGKSGTYPAFSFEQPDHGIMLDGALFPDLDNIPADSARLLATLHELSHREFNAPDYSGSQTGRAVGPPYADQIARYCNRETDANPWSGTNAGFSGGSGAGQTCITIHIDHYLFWPDTGEMDYLYTTEIQYCYRTA